jgi:hypothetical protein
VIGEIAAQLLQLIGQLLQVLLQLTAGTAKKVQHSLEDITNERGHFMTAGIRKQVNHWCAGCNTSLIAGFAGVRIDAAYISDIGFRRGRAPELRRYDGNGRAANGLTAELRQKPRRCCRTLHRPFGTEKRRFTGRIVGAGDEDRTRDVQLGKLAFYR